VKSFAEMIAAGEAAMQVATSSASVAGNRLRMAGNFQR
jgi:hypothetical protein